MQQKIILHLFDGNVITNGQTIDDSDFISESQRNATPANDEGRVPQLESTGKLHKWFLDTSRKFNIFEAMDGTTIPVAVTLGVDGSIVKSDGNVTHRQGFLGFMKENQASVDPSVLGSAVASTTTPQSFTANAGNNRVILIFASVGDSSGNAVLPDAFTWNSLSFASVTSASEGHIKIQIWALAIGTSGSDQTFDVVKTGGSGDGGVYYSIVCFDNVDQTTPSAGSGAFVNTTGNGTGSISATQLYGKLVIASRSRIGTANVSAPAGVTDLLVGGSQELSWITHDNSSVTITGGSGSSNNAVAGIVLRGENATQREVEFAGIVSGFTGLTIGSKYFISDTAGAIAVTSGTANIPVGIAISATEILIKTAYPN